MPRPAKKCKGCGATTQKGRRHISPTDGFTYCATCRLANNAAVQASTRAAAEILAAQAAKAEADDRKSKMDEEKRKFVSSETLKRRKLEERKVRKASACLTTFFLSFPRVGTLFLGLFIVFVYVAVSLLV
jgi:hypothetical protein